MTELLTGHPHIWDLPRGEATKDQRRHYEGSREEALFVSVRYPHMWGMNIYDKPHQ